MSSLEDICRHPNPCRPASKVGEECPFLTISSVLIYPDEARSRLFYAQHHPSLLTEPRRTLAGQGSTAGHARE